MYGVIRRYRLAEGATVADVMQRVQRDFVPIVSQVPGFVAYHAIDLGDGAVASIGVFDSQDAADASTSQAAEWAGRELATLVSGAPEVEHGPVGAHAAREPGTAPHLDSGQPV